MKIEFALYISEENEKFSTLLNSIELLVKDYFERRNYGNDVQEISIGIIYVSSRFEMFFKARKPKYIKKKEYIKEGVSFSLSKILEYDIKLDYEKAINYNLSQLRYFLIDSILKSFSVLTLVCAKLDFDIDNLKKRHEMSLK